MDARSSSIRIEPLRSDEVALLQRMMPSSERVVDGVRTHSHAQRFGAQQDGTADYLVAWIDDEPVGHALIRWTGARDALFIERRVRDPYVEGLAVRHDRWSRGIATAMMCEAEHRALMRGYRTMGLAVGVDNARARHLYDRLGYCESNLGEFEVTWTYLDDGGREQVGRETCTYLMKTLI